MEYPEISILNSTPFDASGVISYAGASCSEEKYKIESSRPWGPISRGDCLVTKITGTVYTPTGSVEATPYTSSGTSYSQFALVQTDDGGFQITRLDH